jgi:23S rRNA (uracil1939-C5)-methyltransferase
VALVAEIKNIAVGGQGVGKIVSNDSSLFGITVFTHGGLPGDIVEVEPYNIKKSYIEAHIVKFKESSQLRRKSPCAVSQECGGCDLIELEESKQRELKHNLITSTFAKGVIGGNRWSVEELSLIKPVVSGVSKAYRNRVSLHINHGTVGFYKRKTREIVPISSCFVASDNLNVSLANLAKYKDSFANLSGTLHLTDSGHTEATLDLLEPLSPTATLQVEKTFNGLFSYWRIRLKGVTTKASEQLRSDKVTIKSGSFTQINPEINQLIIDYIRNVIVENKISKVWDLYGGSGNFSFAVCSYLKKILLVESATELVNQAEIEAKNGGFMKCVEFYNLTVEKFFKLKNSKIFTPNLVIADPPRSGLGENYLKLPKTSFLILINCHLPSLFRDANNLKSSGWELQELVPFDMFPQTNYLECVSLWRGFKD